MLLHGIAHADIRQEDTIRRPAAQGRERRAEALRPRARQSAVQPELHQEGHRVPRPLRRLDAGEGQEGRSDVRAAHAGRAQGRRQDGDGHAARRAVPRRRGEARRASISSSTAGSRRSSACRPDLFYGTGIPACVLVMNKKDAASRKHVLFINADREYREGKAQNFLRPEDISQDRPRLSRTTATGRARLRPPRAGRARSPAEDFNCNIRRYVDNAPPPEPHDVRAHLHGGVPMSEIDALGRFWSNYPGLRERCFRAAAWMTDCTYLDFAPEVRDRRALADIVNGDAERRRCARGVSATRSKPGGRSTCRDRGARARPTARRAMSTRCVATLLGIDRACLRRQHAADRSPGPRRVRALCRRSQGRSQIHRRQRLGAGTDSGRRHSRRASSRRCSPRWSQKPPPAR